MNAILLALGTKKIIGFTYYQEDYFEDEEHSFTAQFNFVV